MSDGFFWRVVRLRRKDEKVEAETSDWRWTPGVHPLLDLYALMHAFADTQKALMHFQLRLAKQMKWLALAWLVVAIGVCATEWLRLLRG